MKYDKKWVQDQINKFKDKHNKFVLIDNFLTREFKNLFPKPNKDKIEFLLYCINSFWSTHCSDKAIETYANVIYNIRQEFYDLVYKKPNPDIVEEILAKAKAKHYVSLISKFCCKCNEKAFPISDNLVREFLYQENKKNNFANCRISIEKLRKDYKFFVEIFDKFINANHLDEYKYRILDLAIWTSKKAR